MDVSQTCSNLPAPFLIKTYEMIEDPLTDSIVSWSPNGISFIVWNPPDFARDLLPLYFKHNNFSSFIRQLNTYGFRKIDPEQWEFANEEFIRGRKHLLKNIHRRKPIHSHSGQASLPFTDSERQEFLEEIDKLNHEKLLLELELQKLLDDKKGLEVLVQTLGQQLNSIENRQRQMIIRLTQQSPSSSSEKASNKKRRLLISSLLFFGVEEEEESGISPSNNACLSVEKLESSLDFWENFLHDSNKERHLSSTTDSSDIHSSPPPMEIDVSSKDGEKSPALTFMHLSIDSEPKSSGIDVNVEPVGVISTEQRGDDANPPPLLAAGENDVFWEQFLTETPGSETQEVQSARRDVNLIQRDVKQPQQQQVDHQHRPFWWKQHSNNNNNNNNVNNITEQMGHLTPTEKT